jgi:hypothetical protein
MIKHVAAELTKTNSSSFFNTDISDNNNGRISKTDLLDLILYSNK